MNTEPKPEIARSVERILKSMGITEYEPRVVNQLLEFMHRYTTEVLQDAQVYSEHAEKKELDASDVRLAIQYKVNNSYSQPLPRELLVDLAKKINESPIPALSNKNGVNLPNEKYCLFNPVYQVAGKPHKAPAPSQAQRQSPSPASRPHPPPATPGAPQK